MKGGFVCLPLVITVSRPKCSLGKKKRKKKKLILVFHALLTGGNVFDFS